MQHLKLKRIYYWYENKLSGLGERFKEDLDKRIEILFYHPYTFSFITSLHRRVPLKNFPYFIIYRIIQKNSNCSKCYLWRKKFGGTAVRMVNN